MCKYVIHSQGCPFQYSSDIYSTYLTFEIFSKIVESVGDDANSVFHEDQKFFKSDTIFVTFKSVTFEIFRKCSESVNFDANYDLHKNLKIFKSNTFENYKSFVPVAVQSQEYLIVLYLELSTIMTFFALCGYWFESL